MDNFRSLAQHWGNVGTVTHETSPAIPKVHYYGSLGADYG